MKFTLVRNIYFHSREDGLISKHVSKVVESDVSPRIGYTFEDSAWHRNDVVKAEDVLIDTETGQCTVVLNPKNVAAASDVEKVYKLVVEHHGWKDAYK
ncbi:hypothetical protein SDC9_165903 [bioreactor metagenome]|uniref:Uncharacterized protein n=1 Tax=bioreactor metagenome TaxID=1076179 RepID=A0A645G3D0_9ZZZZ